MKDLIKPNQRIFVAGSSNEPTALLAEVQSMELPEHLEFIQFPLAGFNTIDFTQFNETSNLTTFFMTPSLRQADPSRLHFLPMQMRSVYDYLKQGVDVVLFQVAYDQHGNLRLAYLPPATEGSGCCFSSACSGRCGKAGQIFGLATKFWPSLPKALLLQKPTRQLSLLVLEVA